VTNQHNFQNGGYAEDNTVTRTNSVDRPSIRGAHHESGALREISFEGVDATKGDGRDEGREDRGRETGRRGGQGDEIPSEQQSGLREREEEDAHFTNKTNTILNQYNIETFSTWKILSSK